jgi:hypothetical protein
MQTLLKTMKTKAAPGRGVRFARHLMILLLVSVLPKIAGAQQCSCNDTSFQIDQTVTATKFWHGRFGFLDSGTGPITPSSTKYRTMNISGSYNYAATEAVGSDLQVTYNATSSIDNYSLTVNRNAGTNTDVPGQSIASNYSIQGGGIGALPKWATSPPANALTDLINAVLPHSGEYVNGEFDGFFVSVTPSTY